MSAPRKDETRVLAAAVLDGCRAADLTLAIAESCTGGLIAAALTAIPGASDVFDRAVVTYSNAAKSALLAVPAALIAAHGAVSREVATAMADGVLATSGAGLAVAVTGIAGPGGGSAEKPVGLVYVASARRDRPTVCERLVLAGDRDAVRREATCRALDLLKRRLGEPG
jgi:nicotinamide-nucleotide amidase